MDISRTEQRILHLLAQGGRIEITRDHNRKIIEIRCFTREGWLYPGLDTELFRKLKRLRSIRSRNGQPYQITRKGLKLVRGQLDNR